MNAQRDIVLATFNARYAHASFGLRYLLANLRELRDRAALVEFDVKHRTLDAVEAVLSYRPKVVGVGVYIWNATQSQQFVAELKRVAPSVTIVVGGPEVSHEVEQQQICRDADYVITGEGDLVFAELCRDLLVRGKRPLMRVVEAPPPDLNAIELPYDLYSDEDVAHRIVYVEASRGCPFECEFCLSSLDVPVRNVPLEKFLSAMQRLLDRGVKHFKFVDRTFNLNLNVSRAILEFFLSRHRQGLFLHFEMIPDRLPEPLRDAIARFPSGALQFEVGVQTFDEQVAKLISRRQDNLKVESNLRWLREHTGVHVHADLIVGLPGEDVAGFGRGFDRLVSLDPQEIQVGMLKRLRGTPIVRHDRDWGMVYGPQAPYEVLCTRLIDFPTMQRMRRFARYWDLFANSGNFHESVRLLWSHAPSPFESFLRFSDWLHARLGGQTHAIALPRLAEGLLEYLTGPLRMDRTSVARVLTDDYCGRDMASREVPEFLKPFVVVPTTRRERLLAKSSLPRRQARHLAAKKKPRA
jgi:radical SAM superfamily enzyme YgiQ (UPF0313 family)